MPARHALPILAALSTSVLMACGGTDRTNAAGGGVRDTLPDGTPLVSYASLDDGEEAALITPDLRIGSIDGEGADVFGDVRGIEADDEGSIYVLDYQAAEVRVFSPEGSHVRTLSRRGEGPGEIGESNGFVLAGDTLFVYDHSKWMMMGLDRSTGRELTRVPTPVRSYGYMWTGTRDDRGRFWKSTSHSDEPRVYPPEEGLQESSARAYLKMYDPASETSDSIFFGERTSASWVARVGDDGFSYRGIPFRPAEVIVVDPAGGFWRASTDRYRIARLSEQGDTTLVIEVAIEPRPVSAADREAFIAPMADRSPADARIAEEILAVAPTVQPVLKRMFVDENDHLWVERAVEAGEDALWDVFTNEG
ncbi:MAG: hypothetical protein HKN71_01500, partial [Gemmatimonadetes bacterium]|nr:hypothetical protein [Gemmatimonadota bacterium]